MLCVMKTLILGPTKTRLLDDPPEAVIARLAAWADSPGCPYEASHRGGHFQFAIRPSERRMWSPWLTLDVRDLADAGEDLVDTTAPVSEWAGAIAERLDGSADGTASGPFSGSVGGPGGGSVGRLAPVGIGTGRTEVFGRFNPSPGIWTGYMLASLALVTLSAGAAMWAAAQWTMGRPMAALWVIPACAAVLVVMWGVSAAGQRLAVEEIAEMWAAVQEAVGGSGGGVCARGDVAQRATELRSRSV